MLQAGIIGCGFIAEKHVKTIAKTKGISLVAVSDLDEKKMQQIHARYQESLHEKVSVQQFRDYRKLLADSSIDVVVIAVSSGLHASFAKEAIKKGKHVMLEKPLALSLQDADDIIQLAKKHRKKVQVCHQLRYRPLMQRLHELISKDVFGEIYFGVISMRLNRSESYFKSSSWKGTWEKDGGMLVNQGIHFIDLLIWLMGEPKSVYGELLRVSTEKEIEDIATGIITYQNGAKGLIEANTITKPNNIGYSLALFGSKGTICIGGKGFNQVKHCYVEGNHKVKSELTKLSHQTDEQHAMYEDFIQAIARDQTNLVNPSEGKKALDAIFALYESHIDNTSIPLPLESFSTEEMSKKVKGKEKDDD